MKRLVITCLALLLPFGAYATTYNTGYVNMSEVYYKKAEVFTVICYAADGTHKSNDIKPLYGISENCVKSDVLRKSTGQTIATGVGHGCHWIVGVIPFVHPFPSVTKGWRCLDHIEPTKNQMALKYVNKPATIEKLLDQSSLHP